jgi:thiol:disulfide interchange protein DsbD
VGTTVAAPASDDPVTAELASEVLSIKPGQPYWVALSLTMGEGWHVNWRNPGDAGLPPRIDWDLPAGFVAGDIQWPYPERIILPRLIDYGYHGSVLLPVRIIPPEDLTPGRDITLRARAYWLACSEVCIPGETRLSLTLPVTAEVPQADPRWARRILQARRHAPDTAPGWWMAARVEEEKITLELVPPGAWRGALDGIFFAPFASDLIVHAAPQTITYEDRRLYVSLTRSRNRSDAVQRVAGILYNPNGWGEQGDIKAITLDLPIDRSGPDQAP